MSTAPDGKSYASAFTEEQQQQLVKTLESKVVQPCPSCGQKRRQLIPSLFLFPAGDTSQHPLGSLIAPFAMPCVSMICAGCGHTEFYNIHALGLAATLGIPAPGTPLGTGPRDMLNFQLSNNPDPPFRKCRWPWSHVWDSWRAIDVGKVLAQTRHCALCGKQQVKER